MKIYKKQAAGVMVNNRASPGCKRCSSRLGNICVCSADRAITCGVISASQPQARAFGPGLYDFHVSPPARHLLLPPASVSPLLVSPLPKILYKWKTPEKRGVRRK